MTKISNLFRVGLGKMGDQERPDRLEPEAHQGQWVYQDQGVSMQELVLHVRISVL